jgi:hypothetical protein
MSLEKTIRIVLAVLLLLCLLDFSYAYYVFVRWTAMIGFSLLAYYEFKEKNNILTIIFILLAILFQPFEKIALGRSLWNIVDVVVGLGLLVSFFLPNKNNNT